jgi:gentisate 1,2-dioxygenase
MHDAYFIDRTGTKATPLELWPALVIPRAAIESEIARLAAVPAPANGRRSALIVHPCAQAPGLGLAPGIQVTLDVLKPGERTQPMSHNSTAISFCIRGGGVAFVGSKRFSVERYDVWNVPSMTTYRHANDRDDLQVRLTYSNAALLEKMNVHVVEEGVEAEAQGDGGAATAVRARSEARRETKIIALPDGALLMPYEQLIDPPRIASEALHWPWQLVKEQLDRLQSLGASYVGRRLYLLFNPATGRTNGTTPSFFATITIRPPRIVDRPHRHTSAAINYYFAGGGHSVVEGHRYEWNAGDLMFSAPGWGVHNHAAHDEPVYELTIQDSPLNIAMESLLWQEDLEGPVAVRGLHRGLG